MKQHNIFRICLVLMAFLALPAFAQNQIYKGMVVDETGEPVIGATVKVVGTNTGSITDMDGNFTIAVSKGQKVEISFLGYTTQTISDFSQVKIVMVEDAQKLDEVVVVGYGSQKKAHLTGSVATVDVSEIQDFASGDLASTLSGMVNGMSVSGGNGRPGEPGRISIRTSGLFSEIGSTSQEPLYVIDGYVYPNDVTVGKGGTSENLGATAFNNLDPASIESISVLKDAAAAVYGARAANGVILVTTKKGKEGAPQISYNGSFGFTDEMQRTKMLNAYQYGKLWNAVKMADPIEAGNINLTENLFQLDELNAMKHLNYDLLDKYWETGLTQKHSVNISGATERANYFAGISYFDQEGNIGNLDYNRWTYRAGVDMKLNKWLKAGLSVSGDYGKKDKPLVKVGGSNDEKQYEILLTRPQYIPEEINGFPLAYYGISNEQKNNNQNYSHHVLQNSGDYSKNMNSNMNISGHLDVDFGGIWEPLKGLNARFNYSKSITTSKINQYTSEYKIYYMRDRFGSGEHLYTPIAGESTDLLYAENNFLLGNKGIAVDNGTPGGFLSREMNRVDNYQMNFTVTYARDFGKHHVNGLFSIEKSEAESEYNYGDVAYLYDFQNGQSNSHNNAIVPEVDGAKPDVTNVDFNRSESGSLSYVGRLNYAYADKYLFEFLFRSDSSTKFSPENYWGFFPSVSAGWVISQENWMQDVKWVDYLKVRGSFGITGRDNTVAWQWMQNYGIDMDKGPVFGTSVSGQTGNRLTMNKNNAAMNRDAHWDKSYKANLGVDFNTLNNRLQLTLEGYHEWHSDILMAKNASLAGTIGTSSANLNWGKMNAWGIEISATWRDKIGKDFKYRIGINTGYSDNKLLEMDWATEQVYLKQRYGHRSDMGTWGMQCLGMFRSFQDIEEYFEKYNITTYMGKKKDDIRPGMLIYKDVRGAYDEATGTYAGPDGVVDHENDQVQLSNRSNPWGFTTNLSAEWKGLSLTAQLNASWGGYSVVPTAALKPGDGLEFTNMPSFWNPDDMYVYQDIYDGSGNLIAKQNREASMPNLAYSDINAVSSTFWRVSGTRIRLNRLTLAYAIPTKWTQKVGLNSCRFNITGQNLLNLYNPYPDNFLDPSMTYDRYPTLRTITVGVNLSF